LKFFDFFFQILIEDGLCAVMAWISTLVCAMPHQSTENTFKLQNLSIKQSCRTGRLQSALSFRKKIIYTYLALFFALVTFAIALIECVALVSYDRPDIIPSGWSISIFVREAVCIFLFLF
jgi:hypothetical protein